MDVSAGNRCTRRGPGLRGAPHLPGLGQRAGSAHPDKLARHGSGPAKTTRITYSSGAELVLEHTAVAGYLKRDRQIAAVFGSDSAIPRREQHYIALYKRWLTEEERIIPAGTSLRLNELLLQPPGDA